MMHTVVSRQVIDFFVILTFIAIQKNYWDQDRETWQWYILYEHGTNLL